MIKNIIFDLGGVLVDWNPRYFYRTFFWDEQEMEHFLQHVCTSEWNARADAGVSYADNISELQAQHPEYHNAIGLWAEGWPQMLRGDKPATVALLRQLKADGFKVFALTNWSAENIDVPRKRFDWFGLFDGVVVSGEEKIAKPDSRLYQILLDRYQLRPEECVFVDDTAANVEAARSLGIHSIQFTDADALRNELKTELEP